MPTRLALLASLLFVVPLVAADPAVSFDDVKPIFKKHCGNCHNGERPRGDLDLSTHASTLAGGISGKVVAEGKPEGSMLYTLTAHLEDPKMPPNKPKIPQRELDTIKKWIEGGLKEKGDATATAPAAAKLADGLVPPAAIARPTPVTALAAHPKLPLAAVPGKKQVLLFDTAARTLTGALPFPEGELHALTFSRDGTVLLAAGGVGGHSGAVVGFDTKTWKRRFTLADETDAVLAADISPDNTRVAFGGPNKLVKVAGAADGKVVHTFRKPTDWVLSVGFNPDGLLVAAGDRFGGLFVWEAKSGKEFLTLRGHTKGVTSLGWRTDADVLVSSGQDGTVRSWDLNTGEEKGKFDAHAGGVQGVGVMAVKVVTAGRDGRVRVWDTDGKKLAEFAAADEVQKVAFAADGKTVLSGDWAGEVRAWPTAGGEGVKLPLPVEKKATAVSVVAVPIPEAPAAPQVKAAEPVPVAAVTVSGSDLERMRATLKSIEDAAERMKDEAARHPQNAALTKAYLQLCEAALAMKAEVIAAERK